MKRVASKLTDMIYQENSNLTELQVIKIRYGIECFLEDFTKIVAFLILFSCLSLLKEYLVVLACMTLLRPFAGGYHARTRWGCYAASMTFFTGVIAAASLTYPDPIIKGLILAVSIGTMLAYAPADHPAKPIRDPSIRVRHKYISVLITSVLGFLSFLSAVEISNLIIFTIFGIAIMTTLGAYFFKKATSNKCAMKQTP